MSKGAEFTISADYAFLIQPFISTEETRYYLNGFYVERHPKEGVVVVATDGHVMGVFHDVDGTCTVPGIVKLSKTTVAACKPADDVSRKLVLTGDTATVYDGFDIATREGTTVAAQDGVVIDGTFPEGWRTLTPTMPNGYAPATFNFAILKKFEKLITPGSKTTEFRCITNSDTGPAIVLTGRDDFFGIVMPMRGRNEFPPAWADAIRAKAA